MICISIANRNTRCNSKKSFHFLLTFFSPPPIWKYLPCEAERKSQLSTTIVQLVNFFVVRKIRHSTHGLYLILVDKNAWSCWSQNVAMTVFYCAIQVCIYDFFYSWTSYDFFINDICHGCFLNPFLIFIAFPFLDWMRTIVRRLNSVQRQSCFFVLSFWKNSTLYDLWRKSAL